MDKRPVDIVIKIGGETVKLADHNDRKTTPSGVEIYMTEGADFYQPWAHVESDVTPERAAELAPVVLRCKWVKK